MNYPAASGRSINQKKARYAASSRGINPKEIKIVSRTAFFSCIFIATNIRLPARQVSLTELFK